MIIMEKNDSNVKAKILTYRNDVRIFEKSLVSIYLVYLFILFKLIDKNMVMGYHCAK